MTPREYTQNSEYIIFIESISSWAKADKLIDIPIKLRVLQSFTKQSKRIWVINARRQEIPKTRTSECYGVQAILGSVNWGYIKISITWLAKELLHGIQWFRYHYSSIDIHTLSGLGGEGQKGRDWKRNGGGGAFFSPPLPFLLPQTTSFKAIMCVRKNC